MSERQMTVILLIIMGAIVLVGAGILYYQRFHKLAELEEELTKVTAQVDEATKKRDAIPGLKTKLATLTTEIEQIRGQIPVFDPKDENDQFANLVDSLRKKSRVNVYDVKYSSVRAGEDLPATIFRARYELKVSGGFFQLLSFLNLLENEKRFLVADGIRLVAGGAEKPGQAPVRELQLNLSTFMQRMSAPSPQAAAAAKPAEKPPTEEPAEERRPSTPIPD